MIADLGSLTSALEPLCRPGDDPLSHPFMGQYPGRGAVSRPSSEWGRVVPARYDHQAKTMARSDQALRPDPKPAARPLPTATGGGGQGAGGGVSHDPAAAGS